MTAHKVQRSRWEDVELSQPIPQLSSTEDYPWVRVRTEAFAPTIHVGPPAWEVFNCTTCSHGRESEVNKRDAHTFRCWCSWAPVMGWKKGGRNEDIHCSHWYLDLNVKEVKNGFI